MKKKFDPLVLITSGNEELKAAYYAGVEFGREKELEVRNVLVEDLTKWIDKRVETQTVKSKKWYRDGYLDTKKMIRKFFK